MNKERDLLPWVFGGLSTAAVALAIAAVTNHHAATPAAQTIPTEPETRAAQIWTCTTKGVKTFSNNPCGENSSLLEVGPINTMNPAMPVHYARAYPAPPQYEPAAQSYADDDADQGGYESGGDSYTIVQGVAVLPRRRHEHHPHRPPYHHGPAPAPRKF